MKILWISNNGSKWNFTIGIVLFSKSGVPGQGRACAHSFLCSFLPLQRLPSRGAWQQLLHLAQDLPLDQAGKFFKIKDLCSFGNESNRNSSLWLNLCTEKQTFPAFCKMRIIYEGELVKRHNAIVAIFMKFLGSFYCERWGENIAMLQNFQYSLNFGQFLCRWWWETGNLLAQPKASPPHLGLFHKFGIIFNVHQLWK